MSVTSESAWWTACTGSSTRRMAELRPSFARTVTGTVTALLSGSETLRADLNWPLSPIQVSLCLTLFEEPLVRLIRTL